MSLGNTLLQLFCHRYLWCLLLFRCSTLSALLVAVGNRCGVNFIFNMGPKVEIDRIEIRGTRRPLYRPVMPDPLPREMVIQVLTCYAAEMWWSPIMHEPHACSQLQGNIIKLIRQDVSRQSFQKFPVRRPRQPLR
jgi:hypothetical protein